MTHDRAAFQRLAEVRLLEAKSLAEQGYASGAYYLAGYAIECALKAKIAKEFRAEEIPNLAFVRSIYTHNINTLLSLAGLKDELEAEMDLSLELRRRWTIIANWSEQARYEFWTREAAESILEAIGAEEGLLQWLRKRW